MKKVRLSLISIMIATFFAWYAHIQTNPQNNSFANYYIEPHPLCTIYTENSILEHKEDYFPLYINDRKRYATCTGIAWFHETYIASLNLFGKKICTYKVNFEDFTFSPLQIVDQSSAGLVFAENLVFSPDGTLLAVCSDRPLAGIKIYEVNTSTHEINPEPIFSIKSKELVHNVRFTYDGVYLATAGWDKNQAINVYKITKNQEPLLKLVYTKKNEIGDRKIKTINFTKDNTFAVITYSYAASLAPEIANSVIEVYQFNSTTGSFGAITHSMLDISGDGSIEDLVFLPDDSAIVLSNQAMDNIVIYPFDAMTGIISSAYTVIKNPEAQLSFPHGMAVSPDGKFLAITNYGTDSFSIYQIKRNAHSTDKLK